MCGFMALIVNDELSSGDTFERRQRLEQEIACLHDKLSRLPETFDQSLIPMAHLYQEILQQRLSALHELD